jgi:quercetin dioxygenase-like cupin family protein
VSIPDDHAIFAASRRLIDSIGSILKASAAAGPAEVLRRLTGQKLEEAYFRRPATAPLAVLRYLPECLREAQTVDPPLAANLAIIASQLRWRQTAAYTDAVLGEGFTTNYGWAQIIGPSGLFPGDDFLLGLLMLGPHRYYPDHFHPAPEIYLPLTSGTLWRRAPEDLAEKQAGNLIWHAPNQIHAIKTLHRPMLAIWAWTSDTAIPARLVNEGR